MGWIKAFPGKVVVRHVLGRFREDVQAYLEANKFKPGIAHRSANDVYWTLNSKGYGRERYFWFELHFADEREATKYQELNGGDMFWRMEIFNKDGEDTRTFMDSLNKKLKAYKETEAGKDTVFLVVESSPELGEKTPDGPTAYVYANNKDILMLSKLEMAGRH